MYCHQSAQQYLIFLVLPLLVAESLMYCRVFSYDSIWKNDALVNVNPSILFGLSVTNLHVPAEPYATGHHIYTLHSLQAVSSATLGMWMSYQC